MDLRNQIRTQMGQGRSDDQIRDYMVERYGDFVLYRPPFHAATALLWLGPPLLVVVGIATWLFVIRRRRRSPAAQEMPSRKRKEIEALLQDEKR